LKSAGTHEIVNLSAAGFYADLAENVAREVIGNNYYSAILYCGKGIEVCILTNKIAVIRATLTHDIYSAERAAKSNNAQIITMGAQVIGLALAKAIVDAWLASEFDPKGTTAANLEKFNRLDQVYPQSSGRICLNKLN